MSLGPREGKARGRSTSVSILTAKREPLFTATYVPEPALAFGIGNSPRLTTGGEDPLYGSTR